MNPPGFRITYREDTVQGECKVGEMRRYSSAFNCPARCPAAFAAGSRDLRAPGCVSRSLCACICNSEAGRLNCYNASGPVGVFFVSTAPFRTYPAPPQLPDPYHNIYTLPDVLRKSHFSLYPPSAYIPDTKRCFLCRLPDNKVHHPASIHCCIPG